MKSYSSFYRITPDISGILPHLALGVMPLFHDGQPSTYTDKILL